MADANITAALIGGALIGLASVLMLLYLGRVTGISGIFGGLLTARLDQALPWRLPFVIGLPLGALVFRLTGGNLVIEQQTGMLGLAVAGLLVGIGTRLGSGCTSGHGVCGIGRRSRRSIIATLTFIGTAMLTVLILRQFS